MLKQLIHPAMKDPDSGRKGKELKGLNNLSHRGNSVSLALLRRKPETASASASPPSLQVGTRVLTQAGLCSLLRGAGFWPVRRVSWAPAPSGRWKPVPADGREQPGNSFPDSRVSSLGAPRRSACVISFPGQLQLNRK